MPRSKVCSKCKAIKLLGEFHRNKSAKDGYNNWCKLCKREYYDNNIEQEKNRAKTWRENNIERVKETNRKRRKETKKYQKEYSKNWRSAYVSFELYEDRLKIAEEIRNNNGTLEVKCAYCGKWFKPSASEVRNRIASLNNNLGDERRLYCSRWCKVECSIYRTILWPKGFKKDSSREVQPELRQMVFKRDDYACQICGSTESIHCHHITGVEQNPIESADLDNCITLCKKCHKWIHSQKGCTTYDLRCQKYGEAL